MKKIISCCLVFTLLFSFFSVKMVKAEIVVTKGVDFIQSGAREVNWQTLASQSHAQFAILDVVSDSTFETDYASAKAVGIPVGVCLQIYHTTISDVQNQVNNLIDLLQGKQFEYPIYVFFADSSFQGIGVQATTDLAKTACKMLEDEGFYAGIYTYTNFATNYIDMTQLTDYTTFIADYRDSVGYTGSYDMWEYSVDGSVDGIPGYAFLVNCYVDFPTLIKVKGMNGYGNSEEAVRAIKQVEELISALPATITLNTKTMIEYCRAEYNKLPTVLKRQVSNYAKLEQAEMDLKAAISQQENDKAAAQPVIELISQMPDVITVECQLFIQLCRTKYNELTPLQQVWVSNYDKLIQAEKDLESLLGPSEADILAAKEVEDLIATIPSPVTVNNQSLIEVCRTKYKELTNNQKDLVSNLAVLEQAEKDLAKILDSQAEDKAAAKSVEDLIKTIPDEVSKKDQSLIELCRTKYSALPESAKPFVTNYAKLQKAEEDLTALLQREIDETAAKEVDLLIAKLPVEVTEENKHLVDEAQKAYEALTESQQLLVTRKGELITAITAKKVLNLISLINSLPAVITKQDADVIAAARESYNALGATEQALITNYNALVLAEETVQNLKIVTYGDVNDDGVVNAKDALSVLKATVGKEDLSSLQKTAAEVDRNAGISAKDALEILKFAVSKIEQFPVEAIQ